MSPEGSHENVNGLSDFERVLFQQEIEDAYGGDTLLVARGGTLLAKYDYLLK